VAIAGGAVPVFWLWMEDGRLVIAYKGIANGAVVVDDVAECYRQLKEDKKVFLHRFGYNLAKLQEMIAHDLE